MVTSPINKKIGLLKPDSKFTIVIPTWNNLPYLQTLINSINKNSSYNHEIVLHINDGTDGTLEWAKNQEYISFTHSKENIGICKAMNLAASISRTEYILYINDDMYVCPEWDYFLVEEIKKIGHIYFFLSATMIEYFDTGNPAVLVGNYGNSLESFKEDELLTNYKSNIKTDWFGSTWPPNVVHKDIWDMVGGYSVEFSPGMYSDPDFSRKLWELGVRIFKGVGESKVYHFGSKSVSRIKKNKGKNTFLNKWGYTSRYFTKNFLKIGEKYSGELKEYQLSNFEKFVNTLKKLKT